MKPFFFALDIGHHRTGQIIGKNTGVVFAEDVEQARRIAWEYYGGDHCCNLDVWEIGPDGTSYTFWLGSFQNWEGY